MESPHPEVEGCNPMPPWLTKQVVAPKVVQEEVLGHLCHHVFGFKGVLEERIPSNLNQNKHVPHEKNPSQPQLKQATIFPKS